MKRGSLVTRTKDKYPAVYRIRDLRATDALCERVGDLVNGRLFAGGSRPQMFLTLTELREW